MAQTPYNRALDLLSARAYTVRQLRRKLLQKEVPMDEAETVIQRLIVAGLLDDTRFALAFARSKLVSQGASSRRVAQDLARKGVTAEIAKKAIHEVIVDEEVDTRASLQKAARRKLASMGDLEPLVVRRRLFAFLARRGYELDEIREAMSDLFA
ncbi:MAG: recombination regulator RecX [Gemmatimonadota bacterium]|nr:recombination regulator RecX [Gemmatimonadota bacterium]